MILKKDWEKYIHSIRKKEVNLVFNGKSECSLESGLEVCCGDGYQTTLICKYFKKFYSTDLNFGRIAKKNKISSVTYLKCDAESIEQCFKTEKFDLIFSSSLLEHLPKPEFFLRGAFNLLKNGGQMVVVIPNRFWKLGHFFFHWVNLFVLFINKMSSGDKISGDKESGTIGNNLKSIRQYKKIRKILWPVPHGDFVFNLEEFIAYGTKKWTGKFKKENFEVVKIIKGPVTSGYGFGLDRIRKFMELLGFSSVLIFILRKKL